MTPIGSNINDKCCLLGDFNRMLKHEEAWPSHSLGSDPTINEFATCVTSSNLTDHPIGGTFNTWSNR